MSRPLHRRIVSTAVNALVRRAGPGWWDRAPDLFAAWIARRHDPDAPRHTPDALLYAFSLVAPRVTFVQIGSNDADHNDPLQEYMQHGEWTGVMVEPVPFVYERLTARHGHRPGLAFENVAIDRERGTRPFYCIGESPDDDDLPAWYDQLGSFSREVLLKSEHRLPNFRERIVCIDVPCLTFDDLAEKHGLDTVDLIHTDTEGYDWEILKTIDLDRYTPALVLYERKHLDADTEQAARDHMTAHGYLNFHCGADMLCLRRDFVERHPLMRAVWARVGADAA